MKRWVLADTHFGHSMLVENGYRPADYDSKIWVYWANMVGDDDLVIHLGDVALPDSDKTVWQKLECMPGRKILVRGNHDKRSPKWYMERGFAFACDSFVMRGILFTHAPALSVGGEVKVNLHGHLHLGMHRDYTPREWHRLVSLEGSNYAPVALDKAIRDKMTADS